MFVLIIMVKMNARSMRPMSKERKIEIKRESRSSHQQDQGIKQAAAAAPATQPLSPRSQRLTAPTKDPKGFRQVLRYPNCDIFIYISTVLVRANK